MKYLKPIDKFLNEEALPLNMAKEVTKYGNYRSPELKERLNQIMDNQHRVYIPVGDYNVSNQTHTKITNFLKTLGYEIKDYKLGLAYKTDNPKREIKIGKVLQKENRDDLINLFMKDPSRTLAKKSTPFSIVVCQHPYDVAGMSYGSGRESWCDSSCLNFSTGGNRKYVPIEIEKGTLVVYLIKSEDRNINNPIGRVNVKPYYHENNIDDDYDSWIWVPDIRTYGSFSQDALKTLIDWCYSWQKDIIEEGRYFKVDGLYTDGGSPAMRTFDGDFDDMSRSAGVKKEDLMDVDSGYFYSALEFLQSISDIDSGDINIVDVGYDENGGEVEVDWFEIEITGDFKVNWWDYNGDYDWVSRGLIIKKVEGDLVLLGESDEKIMEMFANDCEVGGDLTLAILDCSMNTKKFYFNDNRSHTITLDKFDKSVYENYLSRTFSSMTSESGLIDIYADGVTEDFMEEETNVNEFLFYVHKYCDSVNLFDERNYSSPQKFMDEYGYDEDIQSTILEFLEKVEFIRSVGFNEKDIIQNFSVSGMVKFMNGERMKDYVFNGKIIFPSNYVLQNKVDLSNSGLTTLENLPFRIGVGDTMEYISQSFLDLSDNEIDDVDGLPQCGTVILSNNNIEDLNGIQYNKYIHTLDLSMNNISDVKVFENIQKFYPNLTTLILGKQKNGKVLEYTLIENSTLTQEQKEFINKYELDYDVVDEGLILKGSLYIKNEDIKVKIHSVLGSLTVEQVDLRKPINIQNFPLKVSGNLTIKLCNLESFEDFWNTPGGYRKIFVGGDVTLDTIPEIKTLKHLILQPFDDSRNKGSFKFTVVNCENLEDVNYSTNVGFGMSKKFKYIVVERCGEVKDISKFCTEYLLEDGSLRLGDLIIDDNFNFGKLPLINNLVINKSRITTFKNFPKSVYDGIYINECNLKEVASLEGFPYDTPENITISFRGCKFSDVLGGGDSDKFKGEYFKYIYSKGNKNASERNFISIL